MVRSGRAINIPEIKIEIPKVEEYSTGYNRFCALKEVGLRGRATKVMARLLNLGVQKGWWSPKQIFKALIFFGFDKNWISDLFLIKISAEYYFKDRSWKKERNIKEVMEDNENGPRK